MFIFTSKVCEGYRVLLGFVSVNESLFLCFWAFEAYEKVDWICYWGGLWLGIRNLDILNP